MKHYLDTNSLRQLIPEIEKGAFIDTSFTSILSIIELISGIQDENTFRVRKAIISKILNSRLRICMQLAETLVYHSFGFNLNDRDIADGIGSVVKQIRQSESYQVFSKNILESEAIKYIDFMNKYDENGVSIFRDSFEKNIDGIRQNVGFKEMIKSFTNRWNTGDHKAGIRMFESLIDHIAAGLIKTSKLEGFDDDRSLEQVRRDYDHSIDLYIVLSSYYSDKHVSYGNVPGKNDYFDLAHLIYLDKPGQVIVSDDKIFKSLMVDSLKSYRMSLSEFKNNNI